MEEHSLELLGKVYSQAMERRDKERSGSEGPEAPRDSTELPPDSSDATIGELLGSPPERSRADADKSSTAADACPVNPKTILEALLFVGLPESSISARLAASLIRGVSPDEIEQLVDQLNQSYEADHAPFRICRDADGLRLSLMDELDPIRQRVLGPIRESRLGSAAIEVLAVVAYHQPVTTDDVDRLRNRHSGPVLNLLVRRELLTVERDPENRRLRRFRTAPRFLELFGLDSIEDLPQAHSPHGADFLDE
jgi:segregation and condensation protein B